MVKEIQAKSALHHLHSAYLPYEWDLNIYRGCSHGCRYCYALYSHQYLDDSDFHAEVYVKTNIVSLLERQLSSPRWRGAAINLGGVCDSYQPLEQKYELTRAVLEILLKYENPVYILTKSDLILRDLDLIRQLSEKTTVYLGTSVTTLDSALASQLEPGAPSPDRRLAMISRLKAETKAICGLFIMPILPYITDSESNLGQLLAAAAEHHLDYAMTGFLNLRSQTRICYLNFVEQQFPALSEPTRQLFKGSFVSKTYREEKTALTHRLRKQYLIPGYISSEKKIDPQAPSARQLKLWGEDQ